MHRTKPFPAEIACALPIRFSPKAPQKIYWTYISELLQLCIVNS